jgi:hypothetical protein
VAGDNINFVTEGGSQQAAEGLVRADIFQGMEDQGVVGDDGVAVEGAAFVEERLSRVESQEDAAEMVGPPGLEPGTDRL